MTSRILYKGNLRTEATHIKSGQKIITDAPIDNNGKGEAFSPTDLLATSLGTCMITIMGIAAQNHNIDIDNAEVQIVKYMSAHPRKVAQIDVKLFMPQNEYTDGQKKILEKAGMTCPVALSLDPSVIQNIQFIWAQ